MTQSRLKRYCIRRADGAFYCGPTSAADPVTPNWLPSPALVYLWDEEDLDIARRNADRLDLLGFSCRIEEFSAPA